MPSDPPDAVAALRAFNRFHTRFSGALQPSYMDSGLGVTAARLLYEIAQSPDGVLASALCATLDLDAGHVSRMVGMFQKRGWITRDRGDDARQRPIRLTQDGRAAFAALDARTRADTEARIAGLDMARRADLVEALGRARALLGDAQAAGWTIRTFAVGDLTLIASRQARLYDREYGWGRAMELLQGEIITAFLRDFQPGREQCWVAEREGAMLGAVLLADAGGGTAKLRLLHVEAEARGLGIGRALVEQCVLFAASAGYARIRLWTQSVLTSARRLYQATGFALIGAEEHQLLGSPLTGETWERPLP